MFEINLFKLNKDVPVYLKKTVALLHYDKKERALYILHNRDDFDGDKPSDFARDKYLSHGYIFLTSFGKVYGISDTEITPWDKIIKTSTLMKDIKKGKL